jgi:D-inositol-3-phosphate glycosyltransferase
MDDERPFWGGFVELALAGNTNGVEVALLTGGADKPYAFGLATALMTRVAALEVIGNNELDCSELRSAATVKYLNLRGEQQSDVGFGLKILRILKYYAQLIRYSAKAKPNIFHILWNNKFEYFDRTLLMLWYRLCGKSIVLTVHNVNGRKRDGKDTAINRITLGIQYRLSDHIFVHTETMKQELISDFAVRNEKISVIPFGINNAVPNTQLTPKEARQRLGYTGPEKIVLFFGNIAPYKGLEYLIAAFRRIVHSKDDYRLVIAGKPKNCEDYWNPLRSKISEEVQNGSIIVRDEFIPDADTELYMKAADVLVLPYRHIYQSGVLFLGYSFGVPVLAADVGSLREEIVEGKTGFVFRSEDSADLAHTIRRYFASDLFRELEERRAEIRKWAAERHSWDRVGDITYGVYSMLKYGTSEKGFPENSAGPAIDTNMT